MRNFWFIPIIGFAVTERLTKRDSVALCLFSTAIGGKKFEVL
jgi:hypothetical protein